MITFLFQADPVTLVEKRTIRHASMLAPEGSIEIVSSTLDGIDDAPANRHAVPVGTVEFCRAWMERGGIREPDPLDFPVSLRRFLGRNVERLENYAAAPLGAWVKPVRTKAWDAHVKAAGTPPEGEVWASGPLRLIAEWRVYVLNGRALGLGRYDDGEDDDLEFCQQTLADMLSAFSGSGEAPRAYALDIALTHDSKTVLIEATDAWAIGYYKGSCSPTHYAELLASRWREIAGNTK